MTFCDWSTLRCCPMKCQRRSNTTNAIPPARSVPLGTWWCHWALGEPPPRLSFSIVTLTNRGRRDQKKWPRREGLSAHNLWRHCGTHQQRYRWVSQVGVLVRRGCLIYTSSVIRTVSWRMHRELENACRWQHNAVDYQGGQVGILCMCCCGKPCMALLHWGEETLKSFSEYMGVVIGDREKRGCDLSHVRTTNKG